MQFCPLECESHSRSVRVDYKGLRDNIHRFSVSSLSSSSTWLVDVQLSHKFNLSHYSPEQLLTSGIVRVYSNDPGFKYWGPAYYHTLLNCQIYSEFRAPRDPQHQYLCLHTELAVLQLLSNLGPGVLQESFSQVLTWNGSEYI